MNLLVCGLNHKTATLAVREKVAIQRDQQADLLLALLAKADISQAVVLSTCNRTEIYTDAPSAEMVVEVLQKSTDISGDELACSLYEYRGLEAVQHIMRVACGLDSMVLGEAQILGQLKEAVAFANDYHALDHRFNTLFQRVYSLAKHVRTTTEIGVCPVSIASIAVQLAKNQLSDLSNKNVLLLGAGDTTALTLKYLKQQGARHIILASRSIEKARGLMLSYGGEAISLGEIAGALPNVDLVMSATASELPILGKGAVERAMKIRPDRSLMLIDMAVPRDIEPEVAELSGVSLYTIDDLREIAHTHVRFREHAAKKAEDSIIQHSTEYMQWLSSLDSMQAIRLFRDYVAELKDVELTKALRQLEQGMDPKFVLERLANQLTNKLMHVPSVQMRQAGFAGNKEILQTIQQFFLVE